MFGPQRRRAWPQQALRDSFAGKPGTVVDRAAALPFVAGRALFVVPGALVPAPGSVLIGPADVTARTSVRFPRADHLARLPLPGDQEG